MEYFEALRPEGDGLCSDDACPCEPWTKIPRGSGYMYISQDVVDFRRDARSIKDAARKLEQMKEQMGTNMILGPGVFVPILVCEQGAKLRGLDLEVAAADAKYWWETGKVPLRATPLSGSKKT